MGLVMMSANFVPSRNWIGRLLLFAALMLPTLAVAAEGEEKPVGDENETVSFYRQVRPILQRSCSGCHQPAKLGGKLLLTSFEGLKQGGENGAGFEPGDPDRRADPDHRSEGQRQESQSADGFFQLGAQ